MQDCREEVTRLSPWTIVWRIAPPDVAGFRQKLWHRDDTLELWSTQTRSLIFIGSAIGGWALVLTLF